MGCTSSKDIKKKTSSLEDVNATPATQTNKNGQITKGSKGGGGAETAIQIPGTNKSFLAPDGIPFIDEDIEGDAEGVEGGTTVVGNATRTPPPTADQNKNVIKVESSALQSSTKSGQVLIGDQPQVISEILEVEKRQTVSTQPGGETVITTTTITTNSENGDDVKQKEKAATKIQAGIRGFLGRKKVKAIRENQLNSSQSNPGRANHVGEEGENSREIITDKQVEIRFPDEDDQQLNKAATKIQANYKGYKTRKQLKIQK